MEELRNLVFEKINYKNLKMSKNDFAVLVEKGAEQGKDEAQMKKLASSCLKELRKFKDTSLAIAILEEKDFASEAEKLHVPADLLEAWRQETEAKLKDLQTILAINNQSALQEFLAANPGLEAATQISLSQFVKVLNKNIPAPEPAATQNDVAAEAKEVAKEQVQEVSASEEAESAPEPVAVPKPSTKGKKKSSAAPIIAAVAIVILAFGAVAAFFIMNSGIEYGKFVDTRDGHEYKTITLGTQEWLAENLSYATKRSACYDDSDANCKEYGRLYSWYEAQAACPDGYHLPSVSEYATLVNYVNSIDKDGIGAGTLMKAKAPKQKETLGFVAMLTGNRSASGEYHYIGSYARFWTTDRPTPGFSSVLKLDQDSTNVYFGNYVRENYYSVRCLKNYEGWANYSKTDYDDTYDAFYYTKNFDMVKTVRIGKQVWTAQNISDKTSSTGVYSVDKRGKQRKECGMFYTYSDAKTVCPAGWRLANKNDFIQLAAQFGLGESKSDEDEDEESDGSEDQSSLVLDNLASVLYSTEGFNLMNCGMVVEQYSSDMSNPEKCIKGFCSQQYGIYGGFWGETFDVGTADRSIVLADYDTEDGYRGLLPVRCIQDDAN